MNIKKYFKKEQKTKLLKNEKIQFRNNLISFMQDNPVRNTELVRHIYQVPIFLKLKTQYMPLFILLALLMGTTGTAFAAENTVPGDTLYPVKLNITEKARGLFVLGNNSKAEWQTKLVERRLEELEKLSFNGEVPEEVRVKIEERIAVHTEKINQAINRLEERGDVQGAELLASHLESNLKGHKTFFNILNDIDDENTITTSTPKRNEKFEIKLKNIEERRELLEDKMKDDVNVLPQEAVENKIEMIEQRLAEIQNNLETKKSNISEEALQKIDERMVEVKQVLDEAKTQLTDGKNGEAFLTAIKSHRMMQEVNVLINTSRKMDSLWDKRKEKLEDMKEKFEEKRDGQRGIHQNIENDKEGDEDSE